VKRSVTVLAMPTGSTEAEFRQALQLRTDAGYDAEGRSAQPAEQATTTTKMPPMGAREEGHQLDSDAFVKGMLHAARSGLPFDAGWGPG
jgi:hypothetical protein